MKKLLVISFLSLSFSSAFAGSVFNSANTSCFELTRAIQTESSIQIDGVTYIADPKSCAENETAVPGIVISSEQWPCYFDGYVCVSNVSQK